jgi:hypothetical protein
MNKLGKLDKYINSDLKNFSKDLLRQAISIQDEDLNISLKPEVSVSQFSEVYSPIESKYVGSITLTVAPEILNIINETINNTRPPQILNVTTNTNENNTSFNRLNVLKEQLAGNITFTENILNALSNEENKKKAQKLAKDLQKLRQSNFIPNGITGLINSQTSQNQSSDSRQIDMRLAGARESLKEANLEDKVNYRYRFSGRSAGTTTPEIQPSAPLTSLTVENRNNSSLFFDSSGNPAIYSDFNFSVYKHYEQIKDILNFIPPDITTENPVLDLRSIDNLLSFKVKLEYNFLIKNYEEFLKSHKAISILNLPYFYEILEFKLSRTPPPEVSISDKLKGTNILNYPEDIISLNGVRNGLKSLVVDSKMYINDTIAPLDKYLKQLNSFKEQFPFYSEIRITTHNKPQVNLSDLFHEYNLYSKFLSEIKLNLSTASFYNKLNNNYSKLNNISSKYVNIEGYLFNQTFIESLFNSNIVSNPALFFKLNSVLANLKRDFKQVLSGVNSHTEVVGYVLQKYEKDTSNLLQEWYLPNVGEDYLEWIDTQIKLLDSDGKTAQYTYKVNLLVLAIGSVYEYSNPNNPNQEPLQINGNNITLHFKHQPQFTVFLIENSAQYTNFISDKPPVKPDVSIIPYVGIDNKIKFNLNTGIGKYDELPIFKNTQEEEIFNTISLAQDKVDNKITFESDEPADIFEIYKTDFKPKNYSDIFNGQLITIETNGSTAASYDDNILPNKKYYYSVRCIDYHNNISNLTQIFEVELVNDNDTIYSNINIVDFDNDDALKKMFRSFRRYLKISPSLIQKTVDVNSVSNTDIKMGLSTESVWDKNMKIRLTSKQTGRKIDLKFKFIQKVRKID